MEEGPRVDPFLEAGPEFEPIRFHLELKAESAIHLKLLKIGAAKEGAGLF